MYKLLREQQVLVEQLLDPPHETCEVRRHHLSDFSERFARVWFVLSLTVSITWWAPPRVTKIKTRNQKSVFSVKKSDFLVFWKTKKSLLNDWVLTTFCPLFLLYRRRKWHFDHVFEPFCAQPPDPSKIDFFVIFEKVWTLMIFHATHLRCSWSFLLIAWHTLCCFYNSD